MEMYFDEENCAHYFGLQLCCPLQDLVLLLIKSFTFSSLRRIGKVMSGVRGGGSV